MPEDVERGIRALKHRLGEDGASLLREVDTREGEFASFDYPLPTDFLGVDRTLQIGFGRVFPRYGLTLKVTPSAWLQWPHVMKNSVCLFGDARPYSGTPESIVCTEIDRLYQLIQDVLPSSSPVRRREQFDREITNYWGQQLNVAPGQYVLVAVPDQFGPLYALTDSRPRNGNHTTWLSPDPVALESMERRLLIRARKVRAPAKAGFFLPLASYPDLRMPESDRISEWLESSIEKGTISEFNQWLSETSSYPLRILILRLPSNSAASTFMALTIRGTCIAQMSVPRYGRRAARRMAQVASTRSRPLLESSLLQVLDPQTVHSRDQHVGRRMADVTITLVGVGSLGSVIAMNLARAGVGRLFLIDYDKFNDANLGRHVLGIDDLGLCKTEALRDRLHRDIPSVEAVSIPKFVQLPSSAVDNAFRVSDLVIVSTADWDSEAWLWEMKRNGVSWPLLQAWSEPHGVVGHALYSPVGAAQIGISLFTETGEFKFAYTQWKDGGQVQLPACGASYIPGGPVALNSIAAMVSRIAIESLIEPPSRAAWYSLVSASPRRIEMLGGTYIGPDLPSGVEQQISQHLWPDDGIHDVSRDAA